MTDIKQRIIVVMAAVFAIDESTVPDDCSYGSFERWDSLGHMNLIVSLEEDFNIRFSDDEVLEMLNFKLIELIISDKLIENGKENQ